MQQSVETIANKALGNQPANQNATGSGNWKVKLSSEFLNLVNNDRKYGGFRDRITGEYWTETFNSQAAAQAQINEICEWAKPQTSGGITTSDPRVQSLCNQGRLGTVVEVK